MALSKIRFLIFMTLLSTRGFAGDGPLIGVLEAPQCNEKAGKGIRALFVKEGRKWTSLGHEDAGRRFIAPRMKWEFSHEGKRLGSIESTDPGFSTEYAWTYPRDRILQVAGSGSLPSIKNSNQRFHGWCSTPDDRPIIAISNGGITDSSKWIPCWISIAEKRRLFGPFKREAGRAFLCPQGDESPTPFTYSLDHIQVVECFRDKQGRKLVTLRLNAPVGFSCCDGPSDSAWEQHTFLLAKSPLFLGSGLDFVGAVSPGSGGQSDLLFWHSGYNEDGYVLFSGDLNQRVEYVWGYH